MNEKIPERGSGQNDKLKRRYRSKGAHSVTYATAYALQCISPHFQNMLFIHSFFNQATTKMVRLFLNFRRFSQGGISFTTHS